MEGNEHTQKTVRHTLNAHERLKRKKHIDTLFSMGKAYSVFPILIKYLITETTEDNYSATLAGFSVSKKKFKHAVKRNRVKRLMREAWRLNKHELDSIPANKQLHIFFIYQGNELPEYEGIEDSITQIIQKLRQLQHD